MSGQPKALDSTKLAAICALVAGGASFRQAARYIDCDPKSIRREAARNNDFRRQLDKAKSEASIRPLQTLQQAAQENWRAAISWMERIDPDRFARPDASVVTKREANQFVDDLIEAIETAVDSPHERKHLFKLLMPAMPAAMRRKWEIFARRRATERATEELVHAQEEREQRERKERSDRTSRRRRLWNELREWLPEELNKKLGQNLDLLDPEEVFTKTPTPNVSAGAAPGGNLPTGDLITDAFADVPKEYKAGSHRARMLEMDFDCREKRYSYKEWCALSLAEREQVYSDRDRRKALFLEAALSEGATNGASLAPNDASLAMSDNSPLRRLSDDSASPPSANPKSPNDLPKSGEAQSPG